MQVEVETSTEWGPDGQGEIPEKSVENLLEVGKWLKVNGKAIYGSKPWRISKEGPTEIKLKVLLIVVIINLPLLLNQMIFGLRKLKIVFTL